MNYELSYANADLSKLFQKEKLNLKNKKRTGVYAGPNGNALCYIYGIL